MTHNAYTITEEQMEKLQNGESVTLNHDYERSAMVHPPCSKHGHEWRYSLSDQDSSTNVRRQCIKCNERQVAKLSLEDIIFESNADFK